MDSRYIIERAYLNRLAAKWRKIRKVAHGITSPGTEPVEAHSMPNTVCTVLMLSTIRARFRQAVRCVQSVPGYLSTLNTHQSAYLFTDSETEIPVESTKAPHTTPNP
jgi:hypothetical protein